MAVVALAIVACTGIGVAAEQRWNHRAVWLSRRLMDVMVWGLLPFIAFFVVARLHLGGGVGAGLALGYVELAAVGVLAYLAGTRVFRLPRASVGGLVCVVVLANTGYFGIPVNGALLGRHAIAQAIAWDTLVSTIVLYTAGFAIGAALGTRAGEGPRERVKAFFTRNPVLYAVVLALIVPDRLAPDVMVHIAESVSYSLLPLGFFILGVNLMGEREDGALRFPPPMTAPIGTAMVLRMLVAPLLLAGLSALLIGVPKAYLLQAAMPSGINSLIVGHVYGLDLRLASSTIAWTTVVAVVAALAVAPML
jgi:malate permease and related proteins